MEGRAKRRIFQNFITCWRTQQPLKLPELTAHSTPVITLTTANTDINKQSAYSNYLYNAQYLARRTLQRPRLHQIYCECLILTRVINWKDLRQLRVYFANYHSKEEYSAPSALPTRL